MIEPQHLPPGFGQVIPRAPVQEANAVRLGVGTTVDEAERLLILKTLEATNNNKTRAAEILGISLKTLHNKLKEYGVARQPASAGAARGELKSPVSRFFACTPLLYGLLGEPANCELRQLSRLYNEICFLNGELSVALASTRAEVAELADAHGSGPCTRKGVGVRVPSSAPKS